MKIRYINDLRYPEVTKSIEFTKKRRRIVVNAPRPLPGDRAWEGPFITGIHYASGKPSRYGDDWAKLGAVRVEVITNAEVLQEVIESCKDHAFRDRLRSLFEKRGPEAVKEMAVNIDLQYVIDPSADFASELASADWSVLDEVVKA
jgi:hypothetical protein